MLHATQTVVTDAYTGRPARGARTEFVAQLMGGPAPMPYAVQRGLTADFRRADGYGWYLGGQGARFARELPAAEPMAKLVAETSTAVRHISE